MQFTLSQYIDSKRFIVYELTYHHFLLQFQHYYLIIRYDMHDCFDSIIWTVMPRECSNNGQIYSIIYMIHVVFRLDRIKHGILALNIYK